MAEREYDERADSIGSYYAAVAAKKARGDTHWPSPDQKPRLDSRSLEGASSFIRSNPPIQCIDKSLSSPLTSRTMDGPSIGHKDFCCSFQGSDVLDARGADFDRDFDGRAEPSALRHGGGA